MGKNVLHKKRSHVRANLSFKVQFKVIKREEYMVLKNAIHQLPPTERVSLGESNEGNASALLIDFLLNIDEKLDEIISIVSKRKDNKGLPKNGTCSDISGSGMSIITDESVACGDIIHAKFILARLPLVYIDVFAEIKRVKALEDKKDFYKIGVEFLDLDTHVKEKIISCVFQKQRENIRNSKKMAEEELINELES
jgi:hypothetical protein